MAAASASLVLSFVTGLACVGPLVAILLGVGGLGWLTRYTHLRVPASVLTFLVLGFGFARLHARKRAACPKTRRATLSRFLLWSSAAIAVAVNLFEYVIFQHID